MEEVSDMIENFRTQRDKDHADWMKTMGQEESKTVKNSQEGAIPASLDEIPPEHRGNQIEGRLYRLEQDQRLLNHNFNDYVDVTNASIESLRKLVKEDRVLLQHLRGAIETKGWVSNQQGETITFNLFSVPKFAVKFADRIVRAIKAFKETP